MRLLRDPAAAALHLPWVTAVRGRLAGMPLGPALALLPPRGYIPDFLTPPPTSPLAELDDELAAMRATSSEQIRKEIRRFLGRRRPPEVLVPFLEQPRRAVRALAAAFETYWDAVLAEFWPRIRGVLDGDVAYRARRLAQGGQEALFADLHPIISFGRDRVRVDNPWDASVSLQGRGLLLVPSAFAWQRPASIVDPPWQPSLTYPARGVATLWDSGAHAPDGLERLLGHTRARLLAILDQPRSTADLARLLEVTPGAVSQHLGVLRAAGLVTARREGRAVLSVRTPAADELVRSSSG